MTSISNAYVEPSRRVADISLSKLSPMANARLAEAIASRGETSSRSSVPPRASSAEMPVSFRKPSLVNVMRGREGDVPLVEDHEALGGVVDRGLEESERMRHAAALRHDRGERGGRQGQHARVGLHEKQRLVRVQTVKWAHALQRAPDRDG